MEPTIDTTPRTTATSGSEGRLKVSVGGKTKKRNKLKSIMDSYKDGAGGPGILPTGPSVASSNPNVPGPPGGMNPGATPSMMTPSMGTAISPNTFTPQQQMQMAMQGMQPRGSAPMGGPATPGGNVPTRPMKIANRPHRNLRGTAPKPTRLKGMKKMRIVKSAVQRSATNAFRPMGLSRRPGF